MSTQIEIGSTSSGSCKLEDIITGIENCDIEEVVDLIEEFKNANLEEQGYIFTEICDVLNDIAPDGVIFGTHESDGACYGFWDISEDGDY